MGYLEFAERELRSLIDSKDEYDNAVATDVLALLKVFADQGHSGFSAGQVSARFNLLAQFKPIGPLKGTDDEWNDIGDGMFQNKRCPHVFRDADGSAYDNNGRVFQDPKGSCYTGKGSRVSITFPYRVPERPMIVKVDDDGNPLP